MAKDKKVSALVKIIVLISSALLMFLRVPSLFTGPRLWAEEGTRYFPYAYYFAHSPLWYKGLTNIQLGYFALWPNIASTIAANLAPLEQVPLVTTLLAFVVQIIPVAIILWGHSNLWKTSIQKTISILIVLFTPLSAEIWLNTINSQFYFALITFLILNASIDVSTVQKWLYRGLLLLAGLTGPVSCLLSPLFIFKAWLEKKAERVIHAIVLSICSIIQIMVLWTSVHNNVTIPTRFTGADLASLTSVVWTQSIGLTLLGLDSARGFAQLINTIHNLSGYEFRYMGVVLLFVEVLFLVYISSELHLQERLVLVGSYLFVIIFSILGSRPNDEFTLVSPGSGQRYFFVPNAILMFLILINLQRAKEMFKMGKSSLLTILLVVSLALGAIEYKEMPFTSDDWPKWKDEILMWRENPERLIEIWPPGWQMRLSKPEQ